MIAQTVNRYVLHLNMFVFLFNFIQLSVEYETEYKSDEKMISVEFKDDKSVCFLLVYSYS